MLLAQAEISEIIEQLWEGNCPSPKEPNNWMLHARCQKAVEDFKKSTQDSVSMENGTPSCSGSTLATTTNMNILISSSSESIASPSGFYSEQQQQQQQQQQQLSIN